MTIEQKALELDLIARVIGAYHTTRLANTDVHKHKWGKPSVREGLDRLIASAVNGGSRHGNL